jgi:hypothetical protein
MAPVDRNLFRIDLSDAPRPRRSGRVAQPGECPVLDGLRDMGADPESHGLNSMRHLAITLDCCCIVCDTQIK